LCRLFKRLFVGLTVLFSLHQQDFLAKTHYFCPLEYGAAAYKQTAIMNNQKPIPAITQLKKNLQKIQNKSYIEWTRLIWFGFLAGFFSVFAWFFAVQINFLGFFGGMPDLKELENPKSETASELWSADDVVLGKYFRENRSPVKYDQLSENLVNALLATEDIRFHDHAGIDMIATISIPYYFLKGDKKGGSTLTQQLAKNLFRTRKYDGFLMQIGGLSTVIAKSKEWLLSIELEKSYTKKEIMEMYLNTVEFGSNSFGIKVAAKTYYNTTPDKLTVEQAAMLVGMLKAPSYYSPIFRPENALVRRNTVIDQMAKYEFITDQEAATAKEKSIDVSHYQVDNHLTGLATYFRTVVGEWLKVWCRQNGYDLYADGLRIHTTIDTRMQAMAEQAVEEYMPQVQKKFFAHWKNKKPWVDENGKELPRFLDEAIKKTERYRLAKIKYKGDTLKIQAEFDKPLPMKVFTWENPQRVKDTVLSPKDSVGYYKHFLRTGLMCMNPHNGEIKAWVGGMNYKNFKYDHVKQGTRQCGSTFKPFVYAAALKEQGFSPCDQLLDVPQTFVLGDGTTWTAKNATNEYSGKPYTLERGLAMSVNTVSAALMRRLNPEIVIKYARNMGVNSPMDAVYSLCLGSNELSLYELTGAYATFVNKGTWIEPTYITRIEDKSGKVLYQKVPKTKEALDEQTAYLMIHLLKGVVNRGTAGGLWRYKFRQGNEVAAKTGTTQNNSDAWFVGATKDLVTGVWVGGEDRSIHFLGDAGTGGKLAMPEFALFMDKVYADSTLGYKKGNFPVPKNMTINLDCSKYSSGNFAMDSTIYIMPTGNPLSDDLN
jgi:penicillin-binding protein 1A